TNATDFYVYFTTGDPYNATVLYPSDNLALAHYGIEGEISLYESISLTSPILTTTTTIEFPTSPSKVNEGLKTELLLIMGLVIVGIGVGVLVILKKH
ncbi:MAG: hypothetical protein QXO52_00005, partial [Thermosphaera sp.]